MLGYAVARLGVSPSEFWDSTPWETDAIAAAHLDARNDDGVRASYFTGHIIASLAQTKTPLKAKKVIESLSAPFRSDMAKWIPIRSQADLDRWLAEHSDAMNEGVKNG